MHAFAISGVRFLTLVATLLLLSGCGGAHRTLPEPRASAAEPEPPPSPPPVQVAVKPPEPPKVEPPRAPEEAPKAETPPKAEPPKPKRPVMVAEWKADDFLSARQERDPRLPQAVQHLVRSGVSDEPTLQLLAGLMLADQAPPPTPAATDDEEDPAPSAPLGLAGIVVPYFASLESNVARKTLEEVLKGRARTDMPDAPCLNLALRAMVEATLVDHGPTLASILTAPTEWRPAAIDGVTADALHEACFKLVKPKAPAALRTHLARHIVQADAPAVHRERIGPWLAEPNPLNFEAQVVLHNSDLLSDEAKARFREAFAKLNSAALDQLLGVTVTVAAPVYRPASSNLFVGSSPGGPAEGVKSTGDADPAAELMRQFWSREFIASVTGDLAQMNDLAAHRELMLLAGNLPHQAVRSELHRVLKRQWVEGTAPFEAARLTLDSFRDPGFLVLVKSMPREEPKPMPGGTAAGNPPSKERQAKFAWMGAAESFIRSLNDRFYAAARAQRPDAPTLEPPLMLYKPLSVAARYSIDWPSQLRGRMDESSVERLTVHYARAQGEDRYQRVVDFYRRQLDSPASRSLARGVWLDSQESDAATGRIRSVDVMITRPQQTARSSTAAEDLLVEVLWIEIADPTR